MSGKKRKSPSVNIARQYYNEGIGSKGLEKKPLTLTNDGSFRLLVDEQEKQRRRKRMQRFAEHDIMRALPTNRTLRKLTTGSTSILKNKSKAIDVSERDNKFVGKSISLEKSYMRLTSAPKAQDVRPLAVLIESFAHVKAHFLRNDDFDFANEQLKSIRQDITVQHLRNDFVLEVYETHSRMLLEHGDLNEFNQCQTMIRSLTCSTNSNVVSSKRSVRDDLEYLPTEANEAVVLLQSEETADEFRAYSLLYDVVQNSWCDLISHFASQNDSIIGNKCRSAMATKSPNKVTTTQGPSVRHALEVVKAIVNNHYLAFFRLYESAPHMSAYLMDYLVSRVRNAAYGRIIAAYRPTISTQRFQDLLSFHDLKETKKFLKMKRAVFVNQKEIPLLVDCRASYTSYLKNR